jgi:arylsulfatase B
VASFGKWHLSSGEDDPNQHGWPYYAGSHPDLGKLPSYFSWPKTVNGITTTSTTYATTDTVDEALGVIARAKSENRPYVLWVAFNAPHDPHHKPPNELHSRDALPEPFDPALRRAYFEAMVEAMDTEIGRLLKAVDLARTTVIFLGDNGTSPEVTAKPYQSLKAKGTTYQGGVHVPLLVAGAGVVSPGRTASALVNTVDLFPTILRLAGIDPSAVVPDGTKTDGVSLMPYIGNRAHPNPRRWAYAEEFYTSYRDRWERAIRDGRYKLIERADGSREFYDLGADPLENKNLLGQTLTATQMERLRALDRQLDKVLASR